MSFTDPACAIAEVIKSGLSTKALSLYVKMLGVLTEPMRPEGFKNELIFTELMNLEPNMTCSEMGDIIEELESNGLIDSLYVEGIRNQVKETAQEEG